MEEIVKRCASCFVVDDGKILLVYHRKFGKYLQPGGHIEDGEEAHETATREVFEETGIQIVIENKKPVWIQRYDTKIGPQLDYQFIGRPLNYDCKNNGESYLCGWFEIVKLDELDVPDDLKEKVYQIERQVK